MTVINESNPDFGKMILATLKAGGVISFPTDTVYGIAVDAANFAAVEKLYHIKTRAANKPIAIFVKNISQAEKFFYFNETAHKIADKFMPGPLTMVLKLRPEAAKLLAKNLNQKGDGFLGFRIVNNNIIDKIFKEFDGVLAVTSANKSNKEEAKSVLDVVKYFSDNEIDLVIEGDGVMSGVVSTVVRVSDAGVEILRDGAIPQKQILEL